MAVSDVYKIVAYGWSALAAHKLGDVENSNAFVALEWLSSNLLQFFGWVLGHETTATMGPLTAVKLQQKQWVSMFWWRENEDQDYWTISCNSIAK